MVSNYMPKILSRTTICALVISSFSSIVLANSDDVSSGLIRAAKNNVIEEVKLYTLFGADINTRDNSVPTVRDDHPGGTPLIYSSYYGEIELVDFLLRHGADPNAIDKNNETPLSAAVRSGVLSIFNLLLDTGAHLALNPPSSPKWSAADLLLIAAQGDHEQILTSLLSRGASVEHVGWISEASAPQTALVLASEYAGPSLVRFLIASGAAPNHQPVVGKEKGSTPLITAISKDKTAVADVLLKSGASVSLKGNDFMEGDNVSPLYVAVGRRNEDAIRMILLRHPDKEDLKNALQHARHNWNGVKPEDQNIIRLLSNRR